MGKTIRYKTGTPCSIYSKPNLHAEFCREHYNLSRRKPLKSDSPDMRGSLFRRLDAEGTAIPCDEPNCSRNRHAGGLCNMHYQRKRDETIGLRAGCPVPGCTRLIRPETPVCKAHYRYVWRYKMTVPELIELLTDPVCGNPGCNETTKLHVDHDHSCCSEPQGRTCGTCTRGLLCAGCNKALGLIQDNPRKLQGLVEYLLSYEATE